MGKDMGIAFEGATLEEAYLKAASAYECSITNLKSEIIQTPSNGFLGMFKKNAIIKVYEHTKNDKKIKQKINVTEPAVKKVPVEKDNIEVVEKNNEVNVTESSKKEDIFGGFYSNKSEKAFENIDINEIKQEIDTLFSHLQYEIDPVMVKEFDKNTIYVEFSGADSALLIGKEGYRYKALSYILFNWIHDKYGKMLRLEIAEFLKSQEENMKKYLEPIIEIIQDEGYYKTKTLDGILVHIALTQLREAFPEKYIAVKTNARGEKYILVNEYRN
ncbi:MAG TPA: protein jag [Arcobacter sp.]|nr:protein jag [Arcobacter sp.]